MLLPRIMLPTRHTRRKPVRRGSGRDNRVGDLGSGRLRGVGLGPAEFYQRMSVGPARIAGLFRQGRAVEPDSPANLTVFDPAEKWTVDNLMSRAENTPFLGAALTGRPRYTIFDGKLTWRDGKVSS